MAEFAGYSINFKLSRPITNRYGAPTSWFQLSTLHLQRLKTDNYPLANYLVRKGLDSEDVLSIEAWCIANIGVTL